MLLLSRGALIGVGYIASGIVKTSHRISTRPAFRGVSFNSRDVAYFPFSPFLLKSPLFGNKLATEGSFFGVVAPACLATVKARMDSSPLINSAALSINSCKSEGGL
jgi:hypothetical protein